MYQSTRENVISFYNIFLLIRIHHVYLLFFHKSHLGTFSFFNFLDFFEIFFAGGFRVLLINKWAAIWKNAPILEYKFSDSVDFELTLAMNISATGSV